MNLKNTCISACVLGLGLVVLGGCEASVAAGPSTTTTTSVSVVPNDQAIQSVTNTRCSRENACNNIGADNKKYESFDACTREIGHDTGITLRAEKCPNGIISERLDSCLNDIRTERCGNPIDSLERVAACRKAMLCR